jgi:hypothetical protein
MAFIDRPFRADPKGALLGQLLCCGLVTLRSRRGSVFCIVSVILTL